MNLAEKRMVDLLKDLRDNHAVVGVKMEFEAEGTRIEEAMRLNEIRLRSGLKLATKIGGCEALRDMYDAKNLGTDYLVAPMVESSYALMKYIQAVSLAFDQEEQRDLEILINIETNLSINHLPTLLDTNASQFLDGIVIGRVDLCGSLGLSQNTVNSSGIFGKCFYVSEMIPANKTVVIGGGISSDSIEFLKGIKHLDRYETRKIIFDAKPGIQSKHGFLKAVQFELEWLKNKQNYYKSISEQDNQRIAMLEKRYAGT